MSSGRGGFGRPSSFRPAYFLTIRDVSYARDGCVVPTEPLSTLLQGFVADWNRDRPTSAGQFRGRGESRTAADTPISALRWLAQETGVPEGTIQNVIASGGRYRHTELRVADPLVQAIGRVDVFHSEPPGLPILPNPLASSEARSACCAGSTPQFEPWSLTGA